MSHTFRELLRKIASGPHTGHDLTRSEAAMATRLLLQREATPAQIGAFLIAHRLKRPTGEELAGMLDVYQELGPQLHPPPQRTWATDRVTVLGCPYDGRSRTVPVLLISALVLLSQGYPVILHGGDTMPTKYGTPLVTFWRELGVDWRTLSLPQVQQVFAETGCGFLYLPHHFPQAHALVAYRDEIGKRPPLASLELLWTPYGGDHIHLVTGFVHPPTENFMNQALSLRGLQEWTTVKGLEGSCDLPTSRPNIVGYGGSEQQRLHLHPRNYGLGGGDVPLSSVSEAGRAMEQVILAQASPLTKAALWNGGFHLWRCGLGGDLKGAIALTEDLFQRGAVLKTLKNLQRAIAQGSV